MKDYLATFEWDDEKELKNLEKHGIDFSIAVLVFRDKEALYEKDIKHSEEEERWYCIGKIGERICTVRYTVRGAKIRIIGAGFWRDQAKLYDSQRQGRI